MRIGELATAAGVSAKTVRFYERRGILNSPKRLASGYRDYQPEALIILHNIKRLQEVGFTLREAAEFIDLLQDKPHRPAKNRALAENKLRDLDTQITRLISMRDELKMRLASCSCCN